MLVGAGLFYALTTWGEVNRVTIDRAAAENPGGVVAAQEEDEPTGDETPDSPVVEDDGSVTFLLVGSDSRDDLEDITFFGDFEGDRADVVMVLFKDGSRTGLLSLPRDLLVDDLCNGGQDKLSQMLQGCAAMNGPTMLMVTVERLIGQPIDHFALVDLVGFQEVVDAIGGYQICVENSVRDRLANLELDAGCTLANGEQTLAWMRSRHTQELTADGWRVMPGVNDLVRNERQRTFLIELMGRIADFSSPQDMAAAGQAVAPFITVDSELSLLDAADLAWTLRNLESDSITEISVPVYDAVSDVGAAVLLPSTPVQEIVAEFLSATAADAGFVFGVAN